MSVTAAQFRAWRKRHGFNQTKAGQALGRSLPQIQRYEDGAEIPAPSSWPRPPSRPSCTPRS